MLIPHKNKKVQATNKVELQNIIKNNKILKKKNQNYLNLNDIRAEC